MKLRNLTLKLAGLASFKSPRGARLVGLRLISGLRRVLIGGPRLRSLLGLFGFDDALSGSIGEGIDVIDGGGIVVMSGGGVEDGTGIDVISDKS